MLLSIIVIEFFGTGLVLPFQVVYLHEVREFTLSDVGLMLGLSPLFGLLVVGRAGSPSTGSAPAGSSCWSCRSTIVEQHRPRLRRVGVAGGARAGAAGHRLRAVLAGLPEPDRRRRAERRSGSATSASTSPCSTSASASAASSAASSSTSTGSRPSRRSTSPTRPATCPRCSCCSVPLRHVAGRVEVDADAPAETVSYLAVLRRPAMASLTLLGFVVVVRRLLPAQRRHAGVRPRRRRGVHPRRSGWRSPPTRW